MQQCALLRCARKSRLSLASTKAHDLLLIFYDETRDLNFSSPSSLSPSLISFASFFSLQNRLFPACIFLFSLIPHRYSDILFIVLLHSLALTLFSVLPLYVTSHGAPRSRCHDNEGTKCRATLRDRVLRRRALSEKSKRNVWR